MQAVTFIETLRRSWRGMLYWAIGTFAYGLYATIIIQDADMLRQYAELVKSFPPALLAMFGADSEMLAMGTPEGFLGFAFFGYVPLLLAVYMVLAGLNITANDEDDGIIDVVLALPLPRWQLVAEKFAAYALMMVLIVLAAFAGVIIGAQNSALALDAGKLTQATFNMIPLLLVMLAFTAFAAAIFRRKSTATAVAALFIIGSYLVNSLGGMATGSLADQIRALSIFRYADSTTVLVNGLTWQGVALPLVATAALFAGTLWFFQRRDVGV
jgi:ABC-2 type transport system permease protein